MLKPIPFCSISIATNYSRGNTIDCAICTNRYFYFVQMITHSSFMFMGAKVYNDLPLELRKIENNKEFEKQLKEHFR